MIRTKQKTDYEALRLQHLAENHDKPPAAFEYEGKRVGRPSSGKVVVTLRLDPDVLEAWRATGPGYQARMNEALRAGMVGR